MNVAVDIFFNLIRAGGANSLPEKTGDEKIYARPGRPIYLNLEVIQSESEEGENIILGSLPLVSQGKNPERKKISICG